MKTLICIRELPFARATLLFAGLLAERTQSEVSLLTVLRQRETAADGQARLATAAKLLGETAVTLLVRQGDPVKEILNAARESAYDVIAVGWRDIPGLAGLLADNISRRIVEEAVNTVLVVKDERPQLRRILACTGGQRLNRTVFRWCARLVKLTGAELTLFHAAPPVPHMYAGLEALEESFDRLLATDTPLARHFRWGRAYMAEQSATVTWKMERGSPVETILHEASSGNYDMILIGARAPVGSLRRLLMDNVTLRVVERTHLPILVVRDVAEQL